MTLLEYHRQAHGLYLGNIFSLRKFLPPGGFRAGTTNPIQLVHSESLGFMQIS